MKIEDVIRMAREAGAMFDHMTWVERDLQPVFEKFAALVAAHERVECAKFCAELRKMAISEEREACIAIAESKRHSPNFMLASIPSQNGTAVDIANLIRARGEK